jgi:general secretion pathway protein L
MNESLQNHLETWRLRYHESALGGFFRWWGAELRGLLPAQWQARMSYASRRLILRIQGEELEVAVAESGTRQVQEVYALDQDPRLQQQQVRDLLLERELHEVPRDLLLPGDDVLLREVILPLAAESNLRQALAFEMDRNTPFGTQDVFFDYRILQREKDAEQLRMELVVSPRAIIESKLEILGPRGLAPSGVDIERDGEPGGFNLLPPAMRQRFVNRRVRANLALGAATVVLLALFMAQSLWFRQHQVEQLEQAIEEVRDEARRVQTIREQIDDAASAAGFLVRKRAESPPAVLVLAEVTRILPDDTYLDRLRVWDGTVQMQGKSAKAQQLIEIVNGSGQFEGASFKGPTRLDASSGLEIFDLNSSLSQAGGD